MLKPLFWTIRILSLFFLLAAGFAVYQQWQLFQGQSANLPSGSLIAGVPVGGLSRAEAEQRLSDAYAQPVVLKAGQAAIHLNPATVDFQLDFAAMLPETALARPASPLSPAFWDYLWERRPAPFQAPLQATHSEEKLRSFLENEVAPRYGQPALPPRPVPGSLEFQSGQSGTTLDVDAALEPLQAALYSLEQRQVELTFRPAEPPSLAWENLETLLRQVAETSGFDGLISVYLYDPQQDRQVHFAYLQGTWLPVEPDIAFTASSMIKIPILVSVFRSLETAPNPDTDFMLSKMFSDSSNDAADWLMKNHLDEVRGPLMVSENMHELGLKNTFLAGYFALGSPLLQIFETPANTRPDVSTEPDLYNQTASSDLGALLKGIYTCAEDGSGPLLQAFPGEINQVECQAMVGYLKKDHQPYMLLAGVPEATPIAHKHGYSSVNDIIHTISDGGIIYTPGGDYILVVFVDHRQLLLWDTANQLIADFSRAAYNFFNPSPTGEKILSAQP